jgi:hypothetical protein
MAAGEVLEARRRAENLKKYSEEKEIYESPRVEAVRRSQGGKK